MASSKRLQNYYTPHQRFCNKTPSLYLDSRSDPDDPNHLEVYFVNNSGTTLEWVELANPLLYDDSQGRRQSFTPNIEYLSIQHTEAVKVADFDIVHDNDFLHELVIAWKPLDRPLKDARILGKGCSKFCYKVLEWLPDAR